MRLSLNKSTQNPKSGRFESCIFLEKLRKDENYFLWIFCVFFLILSVFLILNAKLSFSVPFSLLEINKSNTRSLPISLYFTILYLIPYFNESTALFWG